MPLPEIHGCHLLWVVSGRHKNYFKNQFLMNSEPAFRLLTYFNSVMTILSKGCTPDNFESCNSLKFSFNIWSLCSNFVDYESFLESNSPDILALCESILYDTIDSSNFSLRGYVPLIWKDSTTHMHGLAVYVMEGLPFGRDLSLENQIFTYVFE